MISTLSTRWQKVDLRLNHDHLFHWVGAKFPGYKPGIGVRMPLVLSHLSSILPPLRNTVYSLVLHPYLKDKPSFVPIYLLLQCHYLVYWDILVGFWACFTREISLKICQAHPPRHTTHIFIPLLSCSVDWVKELVPELHLAKGDVRICF